MLLEALVVTICVQGAEGCSQSTSAYYEQSKELQQIVKRFDMMGQEIVRNHDWLVYVGPPIYALAARQPARILILPGTTLNVDPWKQSLGFQWSY